MLSDLSHIANDQCPKCNEFIVTGWTCQYCEPPEKDNQSREDFESMMHQLAREILAKRKNNE